MRKLAISDEMVGGWTESFLTPDATDDVLAIDDLAQFTEDLRRAGNFVDSAFGVVEHVAAGKPLTRNSIDRLEVVLTRQQTFHERRLANINAFRRMLGSGAKHQEKLVGDVSATGRDPLIARADPRFPANPGSNAEEANASYKYWRRVRDDLLSWFALSIEELSIAMGISYATFANLGKRKPQGRTIRPVLLVHGLSRAYLDRSEGVARDWLGSNGRQLLQRSLGDFQAAINERLFEGVSVPRSAVSLGDDIELRWEQAPQRISSIPEAF